MKRNCHDPSLKRPNDGSCTVLYLAVLKCEDSDHKADLGNASDSDVDPLGGVHRGAGHSQRHRIQGHPATTNQVYSLLYCILLSAIFFQCDLRFHLLFTPLTSDV